MSAASLVPPIDSASAYAAEEVPSMSKIIHANFGSENQLSINNERGMSSGIATSSEEQKLLFQGSANINKDNDVILGRCIDGRVQINDEDKVTQTNIQTGNQESDSGNQGNDQGIIANKEVQDSSQVVRNTNIDNDIIFIMDCRGGTIELNDNDIVTQTIIQTGNQESDSGHEEEEDSE